jgi:small subunit ribosomal protein S8
MLTRLRNASLARHSSVVIPYSQLKESIVQILKDEGFVREFSMMRNRQQKALRINLIYDAKQEPAISGIQRVSKPSLRIYSKHNEVPRVYGGLGTAVVSTSKGLMTGQQASRERLGGEVLCVVW